MANGFDDDMGHDEDIGVDLDIGHDEDRDDAEVETGAGDYTGTDESSESSVEVEADVVDDDYTADVTAEIDYSAYDGTTGFDEDTEELDITKEGDYGKEAAYRSTGNILENPFDFYEPPVKEVEENVEDASKSSYDAAKLAKAIGAKGKSMWGVTYDQLAKDKRFTPEQIQERFNALDKKSKDRMVNYQIERLAAKAKDLAFTPGFLGRHTWGAFRKNSVRRELNEHFDNFEEIFGEHLTEMSKENSTKVNKQGVQLQGKDLLSMTTMGIKAVQGLFNMMGLAYHPVQAEKTFRALKEKYGLADEDDKWYHPSEAETTITGLTEGQCNAKSGWYWDATAKVCRRGTDPSDDTSTLTREQCNAKDGWYWDIEDNVCRKGSNPRYNTDNLVDIITGE